MRKSAVVMAGILLLSMFSVIGISADVVAVWEEWYNPVTRESVFINPYNHDQTEYRGSEYIARLAEAQEMGFTEFRATNIVENSGGCGKAFSSYEKDFFVKSILTMTGTNGEFVFWRSVPEGIQYSVDGGATWSTWNGAGALELPVELENINMEAIFQHYAWWGGWNEVDEASNLPTIVTTNSDGTETTWVFDDYWVFGFVHAQTVVNGEEVWETRTITIGLPPAGAGTPKLLPKNYGNVLNKPYNKYGLDEGQEIPKMFEQYAIYDGDKILTYANSPLDIWFYKYVYTPNHKEYLEELSDEKTNRPKFIWNWSN